MVKVLGFLLLVRDILGVNVIEVVGDWLRMGDIVVELSELK